MTPCPGWGAMLGCKEAILEELRSLYQIQHERFAEPYNYSIREP